MRRGEVETALGPKLGPAPDRVPQRFTGAGESSRKKAAMNSEPSIPVEIDVDAKGD